MLFGSEYFNFGLSTVDIFIGIQALVVLVVAIGFDSILIPQTSTKIKFVKQKPIFFRIIKYVFVFLGLCLGINFFWLAFGIGMGSSNNDSPWVMTYALSLVITVPLVFGSNFFPVLGGLALIANAYRASDLLQQVWSNPICFASKQEIFSFGGQDYNLSQTQEAVFRPLLLFGEIFLILGVIEWIMFFWRNRTSK